MDLAGGMAAGCSGPVTAIDGASLLPFDFATLLSVVTGEGGEEPQSEEEATATTLGQDSTPVPVQDDAVVWRPGTGWLPLGGLQSPLSTPPVPIVLDRPFGFEQPPEMVAEQDAGTSPAAWPVTLAAARPQGAAGIEDLPVAPPPNPLAFEVRITDVESPHSEVIPTETGPALAASPTSMAGSMDVFQNVHAGLVPTAGAARSVDSNRPAQPAAQFDPTEIPTVEQDGATKAVPHAPVATQGHGSARDRRDNSGGTGHGEAQQERPATPSGHPVQTLTPVSEASGETSGHASTPDHKPEQVAPMTATAAPATPATRPITSVHIRLDHADAPQPVDVHVRERGGEVHVAVRGADLNLNQELRQDLPSLLQRLEEQGFRSEAWPGGEAEKVQTLSSAEGSSDANPQHQQREGESQRGREESPRQSQRDRDSSRQRREQRWQNEWMEITD